MIFPIQKVGRKNENEEILQELILAKVSCCGEIELRFRDLVIYNNVP